MLPIVITYLTFFFLESAVWVEESPVQSLAWGRRTMAPSGYSQEDPLGLSIEGNEKKCPDDLREIFPENSGDLSRENFSPCWFLLENHHTTSFDDLRAGYSYLKRKVEGQKEGQLSFLKTHVGAVIDQLDTMINLKTKMDSEGEVDLAKRTHNLQDTISSKSCKQFRITEHSNSLNAFQNQSIHRMLFSTMYSRVEKKLTSRVPRFRCSTATSSFFVFRKTSRRTRARMNLT